MLYMKKIVDAIVSEKGILVAGEAGKNKMVMHMCALSRKTELFSVQSNELIFLTGPNVAKDNILEEIVVTIPQKVTGVIVNAKFYNKKIATTLLRQYDKLKIPLLYFAWPSDLGDLQKLLFNKLVTSSSQNDSEYKKFVLEQLLHQKFPPYADYDNIFQVKATDKFNVGVVEIEQITQNKLEALVDILRENLAAAYVTMTEWHSKRHIIILYKYQSGQDNIIYEQQLIDLLEPLGYKYKIGFSYNSARWDKLAFTYEEAQMSIFMAEQLGYPVPFAVAFQDMYLLKIIQSVPETKLLEDYVHKTLDKLVEYDKVNGSDALEFLKVWITYSGNTQKIAAALYLHRNTVNYRINKIKEILGYTELNYPVICNLCFAFLVRRALKLGE